MKTLDCKSDCICQSMIRDDMKIIIKCDACSRIVETVHQVKTHDIITVGCKQCGVTEDTVVPLWFPKAANNGKVLVIFDD